MLGTFQQSNLRIEVEAEENTIRESLLYPQKLQQWLWPQSLDTNLPEELQAGLKFTSWLGPIAIQHQVDLAESNHLRLILSQGIDGFHEWYWGNGWVQSRLEGVSLLPLNLAQTFGLLRLREFVTNHQIKQ